MAVPRVEHPRRSAARARRIAGWSYRRAVIVFRWPVLAAWALAVVVVSLLPVPERSAGSGDFSDILPVDSPAIRVEQRSLAQFRVPVLTGTTVVLQTREPLTPATRVAVAKRALEISGPLIRGDPPEPGSPLAALPIPLVASRTSVTYLFFAPDTSIWTSTRQAHLYASSLRRAAQPGAEVAVTGFVPAQVSQGEHLARSLPAFELLSVLLIAVIVALVFRSLLAPVAVLAVGTAGYLVYAKALRGVVAGFGVSVPAQLEPVVAALFLGVVTDYCVLFFAGYRDALRNGALARAGVRRALRLDAPVVAVAGVTVAAGIIALLASPFQFFRALGPALALTVVAAVLVSLTLTPALMAVLGPRLFSLRGLAGLRPLRHPQPGRGARSFAALTRRRPAAIAAAAGAAALLAACAPLLDARLSLSFTAGLPEEDQVSRGARMLAAARIRGITAPTEVLVEGDGVTAQRAALRRLQERLEAIPGVARVIGPAQNPSSFDLGVVLAPSGNAARYIVLLDSDPLGGRAIAVERGVELALPRLLAESGVRRATGAVTGQTTIASEVARRTRESLQSTMLLALALELLVLVLYLRSLAAPLAVLLAGLLSTGAALGLTVLVFQDGLRQPGLTFYAPFSTAVLLVALGADYTVFTVGAVWREARRRPLPEAIRTAMPANARAVTAAGVILATTFASVAVIPLTAFRQIAFTMAVGLLLDTVLVRPVLTPALLTLLGRWARWPSRSAPVQELPAPGGGRASSPEAGAR